jgi:curli biogenesis system outer membrane secretion channel CsgG
MATMIGKRRLVVAAALVAVGSAALASAACAQSAPPTAAAAPAPTGPKKRIAVAKFDANGAFTAAYGSWDIGGGLAAQLETALVESGRFVVVERPDLAPVINEQQLALSKVTSAGSGPAAGKLLGAQLLVHGSVTEFDQNAKGGGMSIGISGGGGFGNMLGGGIGNKKSQGVVGLDIRLIDATTGQVLQSRRIEKRLTMSDTSFQLNASKVAFGSDKFNNTVLGQASGQAIEEAVRFIETFEAGLPWTGAVADVDGEQVFINTGSDGGLQVGDRFGVMVVQRELTDPTTGQVLDHIEAQAGTLRVTEVHPAYSIAAMDAPFPVKKGDTVRFLGR